MRKKKSEEKLRKFYHRRQEGEKLGARLKLDPEFRRKLFNLALERGGGQAQVSRRLGYTGKWKGKRFRELRDGIIKTIALHQLKTLSDITGFPLEEILRYAII